VVSNFMLVAGYRRRLFCKPYLEHPGFQRWQHNKRNGFGRDCDRVCLTLLSDICCARPIADLTHTHPPAGRAGAEGDVNNANDDKSPLIDLLTCIICKVTMKIASSTPESSGTDIIQYRCEQCGRIELVRLIRRSRDAPA